MRAFLILLTLATCLVIARGLLAQHQMTPVPQPAYQGIARLSDENVELWSVYTLAIPETRTRTVNRVENGVVRMVEEVYTTLVTSFRPNLETFPVKDSQIEDKDGRVLDRGEISARLREPLQVVVTLPDQELDPRHARLLRKETLIVRMPIHRNRRGFNDFKESGVLSGLPQAAPPLAAEASLNDQGRLVVRQESVMTRELSGRRSEPGKPPTEQPLPSGFRESVRVETTRTFNLSAVRVFASTGEALAEEELKLRFKQPTTVLVSANGQPVDPAHVKLFVPEVLVLVTPVASP